MNMESVPHSEHNSEAVIGESDGDMAYDVLTRWTELYDDCLPQYLIIAPGRVNLIGEHVDHQAYPVCPCAIERSTYFALHVEPKTPNNSLLEVYSLDSEGISYMDPKDMRTEGTSCLSNYVCAAYMGALEYFAYGRTVSEVGVNIKPRDGIPDEMITESSKDEYSPLNYSFKMIIHGDLPMAVGLSSSASLVVGFIMAFMGSTGYMAKYQEDCGSASMRKMHMSEICIRAERYCGVASGGMDQTSIICSERDSALKINFNPLKLNAFKIPKGGSLVIANTCREAPKATGAAFMYNKRVFELKVGCLALLPAAISKKIDGKALVELTLKDIIGKYLYATEESILTTLPDRLQKVVYSKDDVMKVLGQERCQYILENLCGADVYELNDAFYIYERIEHVLQEYLRVESFVQVACDPTKDDLHKLEMMGELMNLSGTSLRELFDCSCPEIDMMTDIARKYGAYGSRLTGAGWGGCTISLVPDEKVNDVIEGLTTEYYNKVLNGEITFEKPLEKLHYVSDIKESVFPTRPSSGARMLRI